MTILSDIEIQTLCIPPKYMHFKTIGGRDSSFTPVSSKYVDYLLTKLPVFSSSDEVPNNINEYLMELKEKSLNLFRPMIDPFVDGQIKSTFTSSSLANDPSNIVVDGWSYNDIDLLHKLNKCVHTHLGIVGIYDKTIRSLKTIYFSKNNISRNAPVEKKVISYGLSSYGYDLRLDRKFKVFTNVNTGIIDPKEFDDKSFVDQEGDYVIIPPNSFILGSSMEKINMPDDVTGVVLGKSTYARTGINCIATPLEAGWSGYVTLEFANSTPLPVKMYAGEGCCQVLFFRGNSCMTTYADRMGKYQDQGPGPVVSKV